MRRRAITLVGLPVLAALLVACGSDGGGGEPTATTGTTTSTAPSEPATTEPTSATEEPSDEATADGPEFPDSPEDQNGDGSGEQDLVLVDVRVAQHPGFDRLVLEFSGTGLPGWQAGYVEEATLDGSGEVVTLDGDAVMNLYATNTTYPESQEDYYSGPQQFEPEDSDVIEEVFVAGPFEGLTQVILGVDGAAEGVPFRVFALSEPSRLVVDVLDPDDD